MSGIRYIKARPTQHIIHYRDGKITRSGTGLDQGVIFSDGVKADYLAFNSGAMATIGIANRRTRLVVA